ncbi:MAG: response regulator transcription factor [Aliarcobacter sp.]|nr:response regulator transcription factor [Aliarcobacter sp.]
MTILLYSKSNFIVDELKKEPTFTKDLVIVDSFINLQNKLKEDSVDIVLYHIEESLNESENISILLKDFPLTPLVALSNNPDNLEGCRLLKMGYKSYLHSFSNIDILKSAIESVLGGNIYVYPKLMQFLVSNAPITAKKSINLDELTSKELNILQLVSEGFSNTKIASELDIAEVTVKKHISSLFKKLNVQDRLSLALILK